MQSTRLNALSSSLGGGIKGGNQRSSSPHNPENPKFSPSTIITPSSPSRFIGPLQYVNPVYIRRVDSILRSFPTDGDPTEVYNALKAHLGISWSKDPAPPPPTEGLPRPSDPSFRQKEAEFNLPTTIEEDSIPRRTRHQAMNQLLFEAGGSRQQMDEEKTRTAAEASKTLKNSQMRTEQKEGKRKKKYPSSSKEGSKDHHINQGEDVQHGDPVNNKLDRLLDRFDKLDVWRDETDRRFENLEAPSAREVEPPSRQGDWEEYEELDVRGKRPWDRGLRPHRAPVGWEPARVDSGRSRLNGFNQAFDRPPSCWDPPQRFASRESPFDRTERVKMAAPRFDGSDATNWVSQVQFYFNHLMMPDAQRLHYAVMLFDPPASEWVFNYCAKNEVVTWQEFLDDVRHRFDRQSFQDYFGLIAKLTQTGTVLEYHDTFEKYLNRIQGVPEKQLFTLFVAGLKPDMKERLSLHRPSSLAAAMALTLELVDSHPDRQQPQMTARRPWQPWDSRTPTASNPTQSSAETPVGQPQQTAQGRPPIHARLPQIRVSQAEKAERAKLGLCYFCPDKWVVGHVCKQRLLYYADDPVDVEDEDLENIPTEDFEDTEVAHVHTMNGGRRSRPLNVLGTIQDREVSVLIDTGSDRDFLHPHIAEGLHLPIDHIRPFRVIVGNGEALLCTHVSKQTKLDIQGTTFLVDLHILPVHGPDVILGMDWLESLGPITADFADKKLTFFQGNCQVVLQGILPPPRRATLHLLASLVPPREGHDIFELLLLDPEAVQGGATASEDFPVGLPSGIVEVLTKFRTVFSLPTGMPPKRPFDHRVHLLPGTRPINVRPYRYPYFQKNEIERQVKDMLEQGIIQRSNSPFSSPVLLIWKKDGTFRFCIDYRALNSATTPDHFPIPTADELFDELGKARVFTKLDLRSGYHQIRMHDADIFKTAFRTHDGHFEFLVMPFGLTNAPSTFQAAMNAIFQPMLRKFVIIFFDDILVYSPSEEAHGQHLAEVLSVLKKNDFFVKLSKCSFCSTTVEYLGHLISEGLLKADPGKITAMTAWHTPKSVKELRGFLGLTGYYRRFIAGYAMIAAPLTELLKKDSFRWSPEANESFMNLKTAMSSAPVLRLPDFERQFCIETDASDLGIGAVLLQDGHPIAYFSKKLGPRRRVASTYHKELYAIVEAVQKWRQYLLGREFVIRSDQKSLKELLQQIVQTPDQQLYVRKLMGYKFTIEYKKGSTNRAADALSRRAETTKGEPPVDAAGGDFAGEQADGALLAAAACPVPQLINLLRRETASSPEMRELTKDIKEGRAQPHLSYVDGLVYYKRRIFVGSRSSAHTPILTEYHCSQSTGYPGFERTLQRVTAEFYWPKMKKEIRRFVEACVVCQTTKYSTQKPAGLLQPLPIPSQVWEDVSMDFITGLPPSRGYTAVMVVVDRLSTYAHFAALPTRFDALRVAHLFVNTVVRHHGFPKTLVSDRDSVFLNKIWEEIMRLSGTKLNFSTAYHPQSDGQTEVRNRGLEQYLRAFARDQPSKWTNFLPWAELALNCFYHAGLGMSPFKALYGRDPPSLVFAPPSAATPATVADLIRQRNQLLVQLHENLARAQQRMRDSANRHRRNLEFVVGDKVLLKLQPYRQHSVARPL
ncbi:uncharacterized protein LOC121766845 [Salvia splendens]|uniref:uncharacterized protein LOC121766845 n=1 Tax=Salvia splendens TaxID=180675 RepID=UPI001C26AB87|nr:uncharacterized protein LOC121766845 [Salvia splendens]